MRLYLDVDGTLLRRSGHARLRGEFAPADHLAGFLEWAAGGFECVWITSRTRHGDAELLLPVLRQAVGPGEAWDRIHGLIVGFATPRWCDCKAQAMDLGQDFLWLDDAPEEESLDALRRAGRSHCWVGVSVDQRPGDLLRVMDLAARRGLRQAAE